MDLSTSFTGEDTLALTIETGNGGSTESSLALDMNGMGDMPWTKCKESLFTQVTTGECTLRFKADLIPS